MIDTEERNAQEAAAAKSKPAEPATESGAPLLDSEKWVSTAPDSPPRTSSLPTENPGAHVAASAAITTERPGTPPHHEAPASAPFANAAAASAIPDTPQIAIDDFVKIDLRVAKIIVAERIPKADKLLRLEVDLGYEKRQILSGIAEWYTPEELIGRTIVVIANLAPRKMRGLESHGMLLAASHGENGKPVLATFGEEIALGSRLR
jgi:methionyl-tRNA synthetase